MKLSSVAAKPLSIAYSALLSLFLMTGHADPVRAAVLFSDTFDRAAGVQCTAGSTNFRLGNTDNLVPGSAGSLTRGYIGIKGNTSGPCAAGTTVGATLDSNSVLNSSAGFGGGGFQVAPVSPACCTTGTGVGQDLNIRADVLVPSTAEPGERGTFVCDLDATTANVYVRGRLASEGDGVRGGSTSGYRVEIDSVGQIRISPSNTLVSPPAGFDGILARSVAPSSFDASIFHTLLVSVSGSPGTMRVTLDGQLQVFRTHDDQLVTTVSLLAVTGTNSGSTGVEFESDPRGDRSGQRIDNYVVSDATAALPCASGPCDDGNPCTTGDTCTAGDCSGTPVDCSGLDNECVLGMCDPSTGSCTVLPLQNGLACDDGNPNTSGDQCIDCGTCAGTCTMSSQCDDGDLCTQDSCPAGVCVYAATPVAGCNSGMSKAVLLLAENPADATKRKAMFKWIKGTIAFTDLGNPTTSTDYKLCVYDSSGAVASAEAPAASLCGTENCWTLKGPVGSEDGILYKDKQKPPTNDGVKLVKGKASSDGKGKVLFKASDTNLPALDLSGGLTYPVTVQVRTSDAACWGTTFTAADEKRNDSEKFKAVQKTMP